MTSGLSYYHRCEGEREMMTIENKLLKFKILYFLWITQIISISLPQ